MNRENRPFSVPPPGLDDVKEVYKRYSGAIKFILILLLIILVAMSSWYQIEPEEVGVVTRFGKFIKITESGLNFKVPIIDTVIKVPSKEQKKAEFGFETTWAGVKSTFYRGPESLKESLMLTGDLNVAVVEWIVHYKIADPYQYLFKIHNASDTLRDLSEATMRTVVGDYAVTEVLTEGREEILEKARVHLSELCKRYETGIAIQRIELKDSAPPDPVKPSFNEVNQAEQERDRLQNEAWSRYNQAIPNARGEAKQMIQEAEGYAVERVNMARGDAHRFLAIQREYERAPSVTRARLYLETMTEVLPRAGKKVFMDEGSKGVIPLLFPSDGSAPRQGGAQ